MTFDVRRYQKVKGDPAFPPVSVAREDAYITKMIERDKLLAQRNELPLGEEELPEFSNKR